MRSAPSPMRLTPSSRRLTTTRTRKRRRRRRTTTTRRRRRAKRRPRRAKRRPWRAKGGSKGLTLGVGAQRTPKLLVFNTAKLSLIWFCFFQIYQLRQELFSLCHGELVLTLAAIFELISDERWVWVMSHEWYVMSFGPLVVDWGANVTASGNDSGGQSTKFKSPFDPL